MKDIAAEAGVSITTVSNVVNGNHGKVSPVNVERITRLVEKYNYVPNQSARALTSRSSRIIAVIIQTDHLTNALEDAYTGVFAGEVILHLQKNGYDPMIRITDDYADINRNLRKWNTAGAIFTGTYDKHIRAMSEDTNIPFIFTDSYSSSRRINNVGIDDFKGGVLAAEHLIASGHRRIAFVAPGLYVSEVDEQRRLGFLSALSRKGLNVQPEWFIKPGEGGEGLAQTILDLSEPVTAAFVTADRTAIRLIGALQELGRRVPEDFSVIGFDNIELGRHIQPQLTTIAQDIRRKAKMAVDILIRHIQNIHAPAENILLDVSLVERGSVRKI